MSERLEGLYQEARSALKAKDYSRASDLLRQILLIDENYKDASRLLAQAVRLRRRRWYNDVRTWGTLGVVLLVGLGFFIAPKLSSFYAVRLQPPTQLVNLTIKPSFTVTAVPTQTLLPISTLASRVWKRINIGDSYHRSVITAITIDPKDQDVIYIGTWGAGVYKSIDGGMSWKPSHDGLNRGYVDTLVVNPQNSQNLFAGLDLGGLFKSDDGGATWISMGKGRGCGESFVYLDPTAPNHILGAVGCEGLTESFDGGSTWRSALPAIHKSTFWDPISVVIHPTDNNILLLAQFQSGVYQSLDGGSTWTHTPVQDGYLSGQRMSIGLDSTGQATFLVASKGGLFVSFDNGNQWDTPFEDFCTAVIADRQGNVIASCGQLFKSVDGGHSWRRIESLNVPGGITALAISPHNPNILYAAAEGLFISRDGGTSWVEASNGVPATCMDLHVNPSNLFAIEYCGENWRPRSTLYQAQASGQQWNILAEEISDFALDADGQLSYGISQNLLFLFMDGKIVHTRQLPASAKTIEANPNLSGMLYTVAERKFYSSDDQGITWTPGSGFSVSEEVIFGFAPESNIIYAIHNNDSSDFQYSDNHGQTWQNCGSRPTGQTRSSERVIAVDPRDSRHLYVATLDLGIFVSTDGCATWSMGNNNLANKTVNSITIDPNTPDTLYAGTDGGAYISTNGGQTWNEINAGLLGATVVYAIVVDLDSNVYAATPYGIFKLESR